MFEKIVEKQRIISGTTSRTRTFWLILPTEELLHEIAKNPEICNEIEKYKSIAIIFNFQWELKNVSIGNDDLAFVCIPDIETPDWHHFAWDSWLNSRIFMTNARHLIKHLPPNGTDGFERICQVIREQVARYPSP